jgi:hypothetical protein
MSESVVFAVTFLGIDALNPHFLAIYPNPSQGVFMVSFETKQDEKYNLSIYNAAGQLIYVEEIVNQHGAFSKEVVLGKVAAGIYNLRLSNGQTESNTKMIIKN